MPAVAVGGRIYAIGGAGASSEELSSVEYARVEGDPSPGTWSQTSPNTVAASGEGAAAWNGYLYVVGGHYGTTVLTRVEVAKTNADGTLGSWSTTSALNTQRDNAAVVVADGYIYALGGWNNSNIGLATVEYAKINADGSLGPWTLTSSMTTRRYGHAAVVLGGYIYALGGAYQYTNQLNSVERAKINVDGSLGTWSPVNSMTIVRVAHAAVVGRGCIYAIGGSDASGEFLASIEKACLSDGSLGAWSMVGSLSSARYAPNAVAVNDYLYVLGGRIKPDTTLDTMERALINADGSLGSWSAPGRLLGPHEGGSPGTVAYGGYLYIILGWRGGYNSGVEYAKIGEATAGDFTLSVVPASQSVAAGSTASFTVTVSSLQGFNSQVALLVSTDPADATLNVSIAPSSVFPGQGATVNVATSPTTTAKTVSVRVTGTGGGRSHTAVANLTIVGGDPPPAPPSNPVAAALTSTVQINLAWAKNSNNETGFKVERKTGSAGTWSQVGSVGANVTTYQDGAISPNTEYYYRVRAYNEAGESASSNEARATSWGGVVAPSNLRATTFSSTTIHLAWQDNSDNEQGFWIYPGTSSDEARKVRVKQLAANATSWDDTGLSADTTYYYWVQAFGSGTYWSTLEGPVPVTTSPGRYTISGYVRPQVCALAIQVPCGIESVTVSFSDGMGSVTTDRDGFYSKSGFAPGTYTVTPSKSGYSFEPASAAVSVSDRNV